jgi:hypothetical protein
MNKYQKFHSFLESLKTEDNTALVNAISDGFDACSMTLHENIIDAKEHNKKLDKLRKINRGSIEYILSDRFDQDIKDLDDADKLIDEVNLNNDKKDAIEHVLSKSNGKLSDTQVDYLTYELNKIKAKKQSNQYKKEDKSKLDKISDNMKKSFSSKDNKDVSNIASGASDVLSGVGDLIKGTKQIGRFVKNKVSKR